MASKIQKFPIVGIGASAGDIPAMEAFFKGVPGGCGLAFVVVTHLSPERESLLHEVVARFTDLKVVIAADEMAVEPGTVYVMPHNAILGIEHGRLTLRRPDAAARERKPIDIFFASLAKDQGEYAAGVVLSGGDSDGTLGVKAIKEHGGLTLAQVQDGAGPRNPDMPKSAIASGLIDLALPAEEMGPKLIEFARGFEKLGSLEERLDKDAAEARAAQAEIYRLLRSQTGHDFSGYKTKTFHRRVRRRMQLLQIDTIGTYVERLRADPDETMALFRDLLINVTNFFRDAEAFRSLEETVIPSILEGRGASDSVRVWVPGCATGEEVFSIAILIRERMSRMTVAPRVQIFATDIDDAALAVARTARYPGPLLESVSQARKDRFFTSDGASYVVSKEVRELCIFSPHSVIRDPPFSHMDLISCRNLLIYLGQEIQSRIIPTFHYAMKPGGFLFLGTSESISQHGDLFATVEKKHRIFQARHHSAGRAPRLPPLIASGLQGGNEALQQAGVRRPPGYPLRHAVEAQVLEHFAPAHVVVNGYGEVVYYSARTGRYLEAAQGAPTRHLLTMARRGLRLDLRSALREAMETQLSVTRGDIFVEDEGDRLQELRLTVEPLADRDQPEPLYIVLFEPQGSAQTRAERSRESAIAATTDLERELRDTRERLQSTVEEYETALEELKASNEEPVSVNEESQSTNEELEASKEELQSLNEELSTINAELSGKIEELDRANNDLKNLFESTEIATVFLDRHLVIRNFTPAASTFFNLRAIDVGRPLTDLATRLDYPALKAHIVGVFKSGERLEHQIARDADGRHYLVRLIPYRNGDQGIEGVVVTFVDVTSLAEAEEHQRTLISELNHRVKNMLTVVMSIANQTLTRAPTLESFRSAYIGRLQAMGRAYSLLSRENWTEVSILELTREETAPFGAERIKLSGPDIRLAPHQGLSVGMVVHELATNAVKYGALSKPGGRVTFAWCCSDDRVCATWREHDGPPVTPPEGSGFGLSLLKGEIGYRLGGEVETLFHQTGLEVRFSFPLKMAAVAEGDDADGG